MMLSTTATGNSVKLAHINNVPAPIRNANTTSSNGSAAQAMTFDTDCDLYSLGNSFNGGSWLACTFVYSV